MHLFVTTAICVPYVYLSGSLNMDLITSRQNVTDKQAACACYHGNSPERHLLQQVSVHLVWPGVLVLRGVGGAGGGGRSGPETTPLKTKIIKSLDPKDPGSSVKPAV